MIYRLRPIIVCSRTDVARETWIAVLGRFMCSSCVNRAGRALAVYRQRVEIRARSPEQVARMESALAARIRLGGAHENA